MSKADRDKLTVQRVSRDIVENQVLLSLGDKSKVALILSEKDLNVVIRALENLPEGSGLDLAQDLYQLRKLAFSAGNKS